MDKEKLGQLGVDYDMAIDRFAGNEGLYEKYLENFKEDSHLYKAQKACKEHDYEQVYEQLHILKGISGTLGMASLSESCQEVILAVGSKEFDLLASRLEKVNAEYRKIMSYYE
ncbi:MAG: Hpt domain-containing protein [Eubacteriales bacterium]|nr:Hpt domain-containing protein [Eubacteriales bacterium]